MNYLCIHALVCVGAAVMLTNAQPLHKLPRLIGTRFLDDDVSSHAKSMGMRLDVSPCVLMSYSIYRYWMHTSNLKRHYKSHVQCVYEHIHIPRHLFSYVQLQKGQKMTVLTSHFLTKYSVHGYKGVAKWLVYSAAGIWKLLQGTRQSWTYLSKDWIGVK